MSVTMDYCFIRFASTYYIMISLIIQQSNRSFSSACNIHIHLKVLNTIKGVIVIPSKSCLYIYFYKKIHTSNRQVPVTDDNCVLSFHSFVILLKWIDPWYVTEYSLCFRIKERSFLHTYNPTRRTHLRDFGCLK